MWKLIKSDWFLYLIFLVVIVVACVEISDSMNDQKSGIQIASVSDSTWQAPSLYSDFILQGRERQMVIYGEDLVAHTSAYLGPRGKVLHNSNGMNCQNCHLDAGTRPWANNFSAVASTYPKFRERSNAVENIYKRINDCFERSMNGKAIDSNSYEMKSIQAYLLWLGRDVPKGKKPYSSGIEKLPYLNRPADPEKGRQVFTNICQTCHGKNGEGKLNASGTEYIYPPLWGDGSFNDGAGLYRISSFAGYIRSNMPYNIASHEEPKLTVEEAWDVAAFVNSQPRPHKDQSADYPDISKKPVDFPFGPYADSFPEKMHKYGPFAPIEAKRKMHTSSH